MLFGVIVKNSRHLLLPAVAALGLLAACAEPPGEDAATDVAAGTDKEPTAEHADLVLINGGIYTVDAERRRVEAAAVRDGVFVAVGSNDEVEALRGPDTRVIDLTGRLALPGFHDAHVHPVMGGYALLGCNLEGLASVEAVIDAVTACAAEGAGEGPVEDATASSDWLEGHAFNLALFGQDGPHKSLLDAIDTKRPILLGSSDGHNAWVNSRALELAGVTADTPDPALGVIERDADGSPSGTLRETAMELVREAMPVPPLESNAEALRAGLEHLNALGVTSFIDAWVGRDEYAAYQAVDRAGDLSARVVTSLTFESGFARHYGDEFDQVLESRHEYESERIDHGSIKLFLDGVLEGETAAVLEPYIGLHHSGELILEPDALNAAVTRFDAMGMQVHMHAIGDRAVRAGLDAIAAARQANGPSNNRHHISHLQMIHVDDIERFAALDTAANFQALWAWPDDWIMELNLPVLGEERVQGMYPIASVARAGGRIVGGSDWNVSSANPLDAIETAVRRQDALAESGPALNEGERVGLALMIDAYTINAAWLMHHEEQTGSIEIGKRADLVVLDRDVFAVPATQINEARVVETLLDGETVWPRHPILN
ncbi:MAG: amidohydrolase [Lysobacterales bacterium]